MLTSLQNPLVKQIRKLHRSKDRHEQGLFLLEGTNLIESVCGLSYPLVTICATQKWLDTHQQLWFKASELAERAEVVTPEILANISTTVNPDGVLATAALRGATIPDEINLGLIVDRLQDPGNLGTLIRTSVACEVEALWLSEDSVDIDSPKVLRASVGEWFRLPMGVSENLTGLVKNYKSQGLQIIATLPLATKTYWEVDYTRKSVILLGNEGAGLSGELVSLADELVTIPLGGGVESLNVAIAGALLLYEAKRQRTK